VFVCQRFGLEIQIAVRMCWMDSGNYISYLPREAISDISDYQHVRSANRMGLSVQDMGIWTQSSRLDIVAGGPRIGSHVSQ